MSLSDITGSTTLPGENTVATYSVTVADPDGISSVSAKLDGVALTVGNSANTYSLTTPSGLAAGVHTLVVTAVGKRPDGNSELATTAEVRITVRAINTGLVIGAITGSDSLSSTDTVANYSITPVDPEGIASVTVALDGGNAVALTGVSGTYNFATPSALSAGTHTITFTVIGKKPDGTDEDANTVTKTVSVVEVDSTPASVSSDTIPDFIDFNNPPE